MSKLDFEAIILTRGNYRVEFEWLGEGNSGDYDATDATDVPLLRFSCYMYDDVTGDWLEVPDASYCTQLETDTPDIILVRALLVLLKELEEHGEHVKKIMEGHSWMKAEDFIE